MIHPRLRLASIALLCTALFPVTLTAQTAATGSIIGVVAAEAGRPLPGVEVRAVHQGSGATFRTLSDQAGRFRLVNLPAGGPYTLTLRGLGVAETQRTGIRIAAGETLRLDVTATEAAVAVEGVEATVRAGDAMNPSRTGAATLLDAAAIAAVPTVSPNVTDLARLSPMVRRGEGFSIAGQNERYNAFQVDGALVQDLYGLVPTGASDERGGSRALPLSAVEQFQVLVSPYTVRHSGFTGGLLNAVTRSGTNQWEGEAFWHRRDERLMGDYLFDGHSTRPDDFRRERFGGWLGGPLVTDRLHLFVAAERETRLHPPRGVSHDPGDPFVAGIAPDSLQRLHDVLADRYGVEAGTAESFSLENPLTNVFARLDWTGGERHRATLSFNQAGMERDVAPPRERAGEYGLSSATYRHQQQARGATFRLGSRLAGGAANELLVHLQHSDERSEPWSRLPHVELDVYSSLEGDLRIRRLQLGAPVEAHAHRLEQVVLQLTDQLTFGVGGHELSVGVGFDRFLARHRSAAGARGLYRFSSTPNESEGGYISAIRNLELNRPSFYQVNLQPEGDERLPTVILYQLSTYLQDEWSPARGLRVQAGLRADLPLLHGAPEENGRVRRLFGHGTTDLPTTYPMLSPRAGFNWQREGTLRTQLRGGAGIFAGRPPLAWLAQAYQHPGVEDGWLVCAGETAPLFDPHTPPESCRGQSVGAAPRHVVMLSRDFRFPQDLRTSLGLDQELPGGTVATLEVVFTRALHQVHLIDLNVADRQEPPLPQPQFPDYLGDRYHFGIPSPGGWDPGRISDDFGQVLLLTSRGRNQAFTALAELQRPLGERFLLRGAYSYTRSFDTQSLTSAGLAESMGRTGVWRSPNDPGLRPSRYDRPHKLVLSSAANLGHRAGESRLALVYTAESGAPYSYVYFDDVNGDGYPGPAHALGARNDLLYVPWPITDVPMGLGNLHLFQTLIASEPCLRNAAGTILARNSCRAPMSHLLDLRGSHAVRVRGVRAEITADLMNLLNLFNSGWGHVYHAPETVPVLAHEGRTPTQFFFVLPSDPFRPWNYVGPVTRDEEGRLRGTPAYLPLFPESQWQAQLGVRISL